MHPVFNDDHDDDAYQNPAQYHIQGTEAQFPETPTFQLAQELNELQQLQGGPSRPRIDPTYEEMRAVWERQQDLDRQQNVIYQETTETRDFRDRLEHDYEVAKREIEELREKAKKDTEEMREKAKEDARREMALAEEEMKKVRLGEDDVVRREGIWKNQLQQQERRFREREERQRAVAGPSRNPPTHSPPQHPFHQNDDADDEGDAFIPRLPRGKSKRHSKTSKLMTFPLQLHQPPSSSRPSRMDVDHSQRNPYGAEENEHPPDQPASQGPQLIPKPRSSSPVKARFLSRTSSPLPEKSKKSKKTGNKRKEVPIRGEGDVLTVQQPLKAALHLHIRLLWNLVATGAIPQSASPDAAEAFRQRFRGKDELEIAFSGKPIINPQTISVAVSVQDDDQKIKTFRLLASAREKCRLATAKLGLPQWAPDLNAPEDDLYNYACMEIAISTFRQCVAIGTYSTFVFDREEVGNLSLLETLYTKFVFDYQRVRWERNVHNPGCIYREDEKKKKDQIRRRLGEARGKANGLPKQITVPISKPVTVSDSEPNEEATRKLRLRAAKGKPRSAVNISPLSWKSEVATLVGRKIDEDRQLQQEHQAGAKEKKRILDKNVEATAWYPEIPPGLPIDFYDLNVWKTLSPSQQKALKPLPPCFPRKTLEYLKKSNWMEKMDRVTKEHEDKIWEDYMGPSEEVDSDDSDLQRSLIDHTTSSLSRFKFDDNSRSLGSRDSDQSGASDQYGFEDDDEYHDSESGEKQNYSDSSGEEEEEEDREMEVWNNDRPTSFTRTRPNNDLHHDSPDSSELSSITASSSKPSRNNDSNTPQLKIKNKGKEKQVKDCEGLRSSARLRVKAGGKNTKGKEKEI